MSFMKEKEILNKIKEEDIEIPESLMPEKVQKKLEDANLTQDKPKKSIWKKTAPFVATAAAVACCIISVELYQNTRKAPVPNTEVQKVDQNTEIAEHKTNEEVGYKNAYKKMETYQKLREKEKEQLYYTNKMEGDIMESTGIQNETAEDSITNNESKDYSDTNVRTEGVDEGDMAKTDGAYIYTFSKRYDKEKCDYSNSITITKADGKKITEISSIPLQDGYGYDNEFYIKGDTLTVVSSVTPKSLKEIKELYKATNAPFSNFSEEYWRQIMCNYACYDCEDAENKEANLITDYAIEYAVTYVYDISDRSEPKLSATTFQDGQKISSRMVDNILYTISTREFDAEQIKKDNPLTYIPQIAGREIEEKDVYVEKDEKGALYTVITAYDVNKGAYVDQLADYGNCDSIYVSGSNIYTISVCNQEMDLEEEFIKNIDSAIKSVFSTKEDVYQRKYYSKINKFSFKNGKLRPIGNARFDGNIEDDYSVDEYNGYLRLLTTYFDKNIDEKNALYVFDETMKEVGKLKGIAKDERVYSALFHGDMAYFVTFEQKDPLFSVDLSNPKKPTIVGELKMPGYSDYLHFLDDDHLLGIGVDGNEAGDTFGIKLAIYDISDPSSVKEVNSKVLKNYDYTEVLENANALYINTERKEFGLQGKIYGRNEDTEKYMLFQYDDYKIKKVEEKKLDFDYGNRKDSDYEEARCVRIQEDYYIATNDGRVTYFRYNN